MINIFLNLAFLATKFDKTKSILKSLKHIHDSFQAFYFNNDHNSESTYKFKNYFNHEGEDNFLHKGIFSERINIKLNIFFLLGSIIMMVFYVFIMQSNKKNADSEIEKFESNDVTLQFNGKNKSNLFF